MFGGCKRLHWKNKVIKSSLSNRVGKIKGSSMGIKKNFRVTNQVHVNASTGSCLLIFQVQF